MESKLYPELSEEGAEEVQKLIDRFKEQLVKAADEAISDLYVDIAWCIESDSWSNFRGAIVDALSGYSKNGVLEYDFAKIRRHIYETYRDEIIEDLNQDNLKEIENLKEQLRFKDEMLSRRYGGF